MTGGPGGTTAASERRLAFWAVLVVLLLVGNGAVYYLARASTARSSPNAWMVSAQTRADGKVVLAAAETTGSASAAEAAPLPHATPGHAVSAEPQLQSPPPPSPSKPEHLPLSSAAPSASLLAYIRVAESFPELMPQLTQDPMNRVLCKHPEAPEFMREACAEAKSTLELFREYGEWARKTRVANLQALGGVYPMNKTVRLDLRSMPGWFYPPSQHAKVYKELTTGSCPVKCEVSHADNDRPTSWVPHVKVWMNGLNAKNNAALDPRVATAVLTMEPLSEHQKIVDIAADTSPYGDVFLAYTTHPERLEPVWQDKTAPDVVKKFSQQPKMSGVFVSNGGVHARSEYLKALMELVPVDSFGAWRHTPGAECPRGSCDKVKKLSEYPFNFAFENTFLNGYVTEKVLEALSGGVVPVVWGPTVEVFAPRNSLVNAADFANPQALVNHLKALRANATAYAAKFAFRTDPAQAEALREHMRFRRAFDFGGPHMYCRICMAFVEKYGCHLLAEKGEGGGEEGLPIGCPRFRRLAKHNPTTGN